MAGGALCIVHSPRFRQTRFFAQEEESVHKQLEVCDTRRPWKEEKNGRETVPGTIVCRGGGDGSRRRRFEVCSRGCAASSGSFRDLTRR